MTNNQKRILTDEEFHRKKEQLKARQAAREKRSRATWKEFEDTLYQQEIERDLDLARSLNGILSVFKWW